MSKTLFDLAENDEDFKKEVKIHGFTLTPDQEILHENEPHHEVFLLKKGTVRVMIKTQLNGKTTIQPGISELKDGDIFGEFCLFDDEPTSANVVTATDCELVSIDKNSLLQYFEKHPQQGYKVITEIIVIMIERLRKANKAVVKFLRWGLKQHKLDEHLSEDKEDSE